MLTKLGRELAGHGAVGEADVECFEVVAFSQVIVGVPRDFGQVAGTQVVPAEVVDVVAVEELDRELQGNVRLVEAYAEKERLVVRRGEKVTSLLGRLDIGQRRFWLEINDNRTK